MRRETIPMARLLTRRLAWIALAVLLANVVLIWAYYGSDREALQDKVVERQMAVMEADLAASEAGRHRIGPNARALFQAYPESYGFALLGPDGTALDQINGDLIPANLLSGSRFADDWIARPQDGAPGLVVASHTVGPAAADLRLVFVARGDPANLLVRALLAELVGHIAVPLIPAILLLLGANALMIHRSLGPVGRAAAWARALHPGARDTAPRPRAGLKDIDDLLDATGRALDRLTAALSAEKRRAAEAAHALRTPLAAVTARLNQLPEGEATERLHRDMAQLSRTVRQILASANADMVAIEPGARADLTAIAETVVAALAPIAIRQGAELELRRREPLPEIEGDSEAIALALTNLVENALIHAGGRITVTVGPGARVCVRDRGPGLPGGDPQRLFEAFQQGPEAPGTGAGLGLSIAARIQHAHGGAITARTHPDGGAEFRLVFGTGE